MLVNICKRLMEIGCYVRMVCLHVHMCELEYCMNALKMSTALQNYILNSYKHVHTYITHMSQV